jgi:hypothetical protein
MESDEVKNMTTTTPAIAVLAAAALGACFPLIFAQDAAAPAPRPVEVRVHVSAGGRFLDDLKLEDFNILEDGRPQARRSLALVRGGSVVRHEGPDAAPARRDRSYTLLFQAVDWDPKLEDVVGHLFGAVLKPGDAVTLVTPVKPYQLQKNALAARSKEDLSKSMAEVLRKDIVRGGGEYRGLINELKRLTRAIESGGGTSTTFDEDLESDSSMESGTFSLDMQIDRYRQSLMKLDAMRLVDESKLLAFAGSLKGVPGQKTVVLFYQREYRPEISASAMNGLMSLYQDNPDILANIMDLFQFYKREKTFDGDKVARAFADAGIDFHFIFMEKKSQRVYGAKMKEQSEDVLPGFTRIAQGTGGTYKNDSSPATAFKLAADVSSDYYILSYIPGSGDPVKPVNPVGAAGAAGAAGPAGGFRTFEVRVDRPGAKVSNPLGYFAR